MQALHNYMLSYTYVCTLWEWTFTCEKTLDIPPPNDSLGHDPQLRIEHNYEL